MNAGKTIELVEQTRAHIVRQVEDMANFSCGCPEVRICTCEAVKDTIGELAERIANLPLSALYGVTPVVTITTSDGTTVVEWGHTNAG